MSFHYEEFDLRVRTYPLKSRPASGSRLCKPVGAAERRELSTASQHACRRRSKAVALAIAKAARSEAESSGLSAHVIKTGLGP